MLARRMVTWCRKFVLLLALAVMPLQGIAATTSVLLCHMGGEERAAHVMHAQDVHDHHEVNQDFHHGHDSDGRPGTQAVGHSCFHHFASALPVVTLPAVILGFHVRVSSPHVLYDFFIPERHQRPPLA